ncbi:hypothetical protein NDN08_005866 [Rhodosorus marinus]|uniref:Uncharacterized protein n=1 Tax=Rhodosorus marinus TaxID=101924 RepID=A0AAV8V4W2_9RHOD|nr:hypothetical protein NDN08_005866 [Rhodosorus marinus]
MFLCSVPVAVSASCVLPMHLKGGSTAVGVLTGWMATSFLHKRLRAISILCFVALTAGTLILTLTDDGCKMEVVGVTLLNMASGALYVIFMTMLLLWMIEHSWASMTISLVTYLVGALFGITLFAPALESMSPSFRVLVLAFVVLIPGIYISTIPKFPEDEDTILKSVEV